MKICLTSDRSFKMLLIKRTFDENTYKTNPDKNMCVGNTDMLIFMSKAAKNYTGLKLLVLYYSVLSINNPSIRTYRVVLM